MATEYFIRNYHISYSLLITIEHMHCTYSLNNLHTNLIQFSAFIFKPYSLDKKHGSTMKNRDYSTKIELLQIKHQKNQRYNNPDGYKPNSSFSETILPSQYKESGE